MTRRAIAELVLRFNESVMYTTLDQMDVYGGSFVKNLVRLYRGADPDNKRRIIVAFPEFFYKYYTQWVKEKVG